MEGNNHNRDLGVWGEGHAADFLIAEGYEIAKRNYRIRKAEIDIIAWKMIDGEKTLCFIEVKTRGGFEGSAERATSAKGKLQKIQMAAQVYVDENGIDPAKIPIQFEHVSVYMHGGLPRCALFIIPFNLY